MKFILLFSVLASLQTAVAGECVLSITREPCPGKEETAFKPYGGKKTTEEKKTVTDVSECKAQAEKAAKIVRKGTLAGKSVVATFDGKSAGDASGKSDCK